MPHQQEHSSYDEATEATENTEINDLSFSVFFVTSVAYLNAIGRRPYFSVGTTIPRMMIF